MRKTLDYLQQRAASSSNSAPDRQDSKQEQSTLKIETAPQVSIPSGLGQIAAPIPIQPLVPAHLNEAELAIDVSEGSPSEKKERQKEFKMALLKTD